MRHVLFDAECKGCGYGWRAITEEHGAVVGLECPQCTEARGVCVSRRLFFDTEAAAEAFARALVFPEISPYEWAD